MVVVAVVVVVVVAMVVAVVVAVVGAVVGAVAGLQQTHPKTDRARARARAPHRRTTTRRIAAPLEPNRTVTMTLPLGRVLCAYVRVGCVPMSEWGGEEQVHLSGIGVVVL